MPPAMRAPARTARTDTTVIIPAVTAAVNLPVASPASPVLAAVLVAAATAGEIVETGAIPVKKEGESDTT